MTKISLQFHATRAEISRLAGEWMRRLDLASACETFFPDYRAVAMAAPTDALELSDGAARLSLGTKPLEIVAANAYEFVLANPDSLAVLLGDERADALGASVLQAATEDADSLRSWRSIRRQLASTLSRGAWVESTITGERARVENHYYSAGAKRLSAEGVVMFGLSDGLVYELD